MLETMPDFVIDAFTFLSKGGFVMIFIFLCSLIAIVFFVERWLALRQEIKCMRRLASALLEAVQNRQTERAYSLCDTHVCAFASIARTALKNEGLTRDALEEVISDEAHRQEVRLNKRIPAIGAISTISPLLGLLGTVTGLIAVFSRLADEYAAGSNVNPGMLAGGIWEALITTAAGLCVAIPAFVMHRYLCGKFDNLMMQLEENSTKLLDILAPAARRS